MHSFAYAYLAATVKPETLAKKNLTNPHCNSYCIDEINFGKLLDIFIEKALIWFDEFI